MTKKILMIAGPNGAGKTTLTLDLIARGSVLYEFINADEIAKGLAPQNPESVALAASKLMINRLKELLRNKKSFAFETTGAGKNYLNHLKIAKSKGYEILLVFLWLDGPGQAIKRVAQRVKQGGHYIPDDVITRRYYAGLTNLFAHYLPLADIAIIIDNSLENSAHNLVARKVHDDVIEIINRDLWDKINEAAYAR